jgi:transcriptional regulator with XRE-family HTH domain
MIENAVYLIRYNDKVPKEVFSRSLISRARRDAKLSQAELARKAKTSQAAISMYEAGTRSPTLDTLLRIKERERVRLARLGR